MRGHYNFCCLPMSPANTVITEGERDADPRPLVTLTHACRTRLSFFFFTTMYSPSERGDIERGDFPSEFDRDFEGSSVLDALSSGSDAASPVRPSPDSSGVREGAAGLEDEAAVHRVVLAAQARAAVVVAVLYIGGDVMH